MRIAVILDNKLSAGGGFQQELTTLSLLKSYGKEYQFIFYTTWKENIKVLQQYGHTVYFLRVSSLLQKIYSRFTQRRTIYEKMSGLKAPFERKLLKDNIDLVYFLSPTRLALSLKNLNYILTLWDLCHRDHPEFPEIGCNNGEFNAREEFIKNAAVRAAGIVVNDVRLKDDLVRWYGCDPERITIAKLLPSIAINHADVTDVREKYNLRRHFVFYPAQFWAHKNHVYILDALKILQTQFKIEVDAVFSGSDQGNLAFVLNYAKHLGLEKNIRYVGFVPNEEMAAFYKASLALVMPTYFGPTNIPPLEAFALGCPVCYPDLPGLKDQVQDAALLMDLENPSSLVDHILTLLNKTETVREKIAKGKEMITAWTEIDYYKALQIILEKYRKKLRCWKFV